MHLQAQSVKIRRDFFRRAVLIERQLGMRVNVAAKGRYLGDEGS